MLLYEADARDCKARLGGGEQPAASAQRISRIFLSFRLRLKRPKEFDFIFQLYPELAHDARAAHLREAENFGRRRAAAVFDKIRVVLRDGGVSDRKPLAAALVEKQPRGSCGGFLKTQPAVFAPIGCPFLSDE